VAQKNYIMPDFQGQIFNNKNLDFRDSRELASATLIATSSAIEVDPGGRNAAS